jgi:hypothetical protein
MLVRAARIAFVLFCTGLLSVSLDARQKNDAQKDALKNEDTATRTVQGVVTNRAKQPLAKAVVQLKNTKTLQIRSFITQEDGTYHFAGLSTDVEYQLKADHDSDSTSWKNLSVFNSKKTAVINLKLKK